MYECFTYVYSHISDVCLFPAKARKGCYIIWARVTDTVSHQISAENKIWVI